MGGAAGPYSYPPMGQGGPGVAAMYDPQRAAEEARRRRTIAMVVGAILAALIVLALLLDDGTPVQGMQGDGGAVPGDASGPGPDAGNPASPDQ